MIDNNVEKKNDNSEDTTFDFVVDLDDEYVINTAVSLNSIEF